MKPTTSTSAERIAAPLIPFTAHGDIKDYLTRLGWVRPLLAVLITFFLWWRFGFFTWLGTVIFLIVAIGLGMYLIKRRRVYFDEKGVTYRNSINKTIEISYGDIETAKAFTNFVDVSFGPTPRLSIANKAHTKSISLQGFYWNKTDIEKITALLESKKVNVEYRNEATSYVDIARDFPHYASYLERHPGKIALISVAILLPAVVLVSLLITFVL